MEAACVKEESPLLDDVKHEIRDGRSHNNLAAMLEIGPLGFLTRSDANQPLQSQKKARSLI